MCVIVVPLPPGTSPFAVKINNNNNNNNKGKGKTYDLLGELLHNISHSCTNNPVY
jgi:hypothetical protein